ncbi:MAG: ABC transporter ATP-binding protein [Propionibacteriaceae bacterium]|jgi:ABC-2 type transport system ATP-binding protein|nr:ABC transporter ATP-binding protein [Propionibacteriaceae bacterium]
MSELAVSIQNLTKAFGKFTAVKGISFEVPAGEVFGFLGANGSGKTTTIRMLTGGLKPTSGKAYVLGVDVAKRSDEIRRRIGYMSQKFSLFEDLTVDENLRFYGGVYELSDDVFAQRREYILKMADLSGRENELAKNLSAGWRQRLALGTATIHQPDLLFLDEPTSGVDPIARRHFWDLLYELADQGVTLFVTTHYMNEASHCSQLAFMNSGHLVAKGAPSELRASHGGKSMDEVFAELEAADPESSRPGRQ